MVYLPYAICSQHSRQHMILMIHDTLLCYLLQVAISSYHAILSIAVVVATSYTITSTMRAATINSTINY